MPKRLNKLPSYRRHSIRDVAFVVIDGQRTYLPGRTDAREPAPVLPVEDDRIEAALPFMPRIVADMARIQRLCGARPGEMVILRPCDVKRDGKVWKYTPRATRTSIAARVE